MSQIKRFFQWLLPYTCILCNQPADREQDLCQACWHDCPFIHEGCLRCGLPLTTNVTDAICGRCLQANNTLITELYAVFLYIKPVTHLILELKFKPALVNAQLIGELLSHKMLTAYAGKPLPEIIIPMPMHAVRLKERGFNQAIEIARPVAKKLKIPLNITHCLRTRATVAQATLQRSQRLQNVKGAFAIKQPFPFAHVAVVDDVITTGNTMQEFCKMLKKAGVTRIDVWCAARAVLKPS